MQQNKIANSTGKGWIKKILPEAWSIIKETFKNWQDDRAAGWAAALAYYTVFSLAPLLIVAIAIAGLVFGSSSAQNHLIHQMTGLIGHEGAQAVQLLLTSASKPSSNIIAMVFGVGVLILGATQVFVQLQDTLNLIWHVKLKPDKPISGIVRIRFLSFQMVLGIGFLLLVSLVISALLAGLGKYLNNLVPGLHIVMEILNVIVSFGFITLLFAALFKFLPDIIIAWKDVWVGAAITSLLFSLGKYLIGLYLGQASFGSSYGAAGSLVILLLWVNYSSQILFFGAEFTKVYASKYGTLVAPDKNALAVE